MNSAALRDDLARLFRADAVDHEEVMQECISICQLFKMAAQDLFISWEAFDLGNSAHVKGKDKGRTVLNVELARQLKAHLQRTREAESARVGNTTSRAAAPRRSLPLRGAMKAATASFSGSSASTSVLPLQPSITLNCDGPGIQSNRRYMHGKISQRSEALDDLIDEFGELVRQQYTIDELGDPAAVTEEDVIVVGRICSDADSKLNETSILLESSRMSGSGVRVPIKFDSNYTLRDVNQTGIGLFPGCIVALKGRNGGGGWFAVTEVLDLPSLHPAKGSDLGDPSIDMFSAIIASGPFTADSDLLYGPLDALMSDISKLKPNVLLLLGPFVDANHPLIKTGDVESTPQEIFQRRIAARLQDCLQSHPGLTVALMPSVRDLVSTHSAFPQAPLMYEEDLGLPKTVHLLSNPCTFSVNGITVAASTVDVLFHLRKEEFFKRTDTSRSSTLVPDPMSSLVRHILTQQSFYPLFPPPKDNAADVNLDLTHIDLLRFRPNAPAILVLPSILKQFSKVVDDVLVINPSHLTKGTFVYISVPQMERSTTSHEVWNWEKVVVDIHKLSV